MIRTLEQESSVMAIFRKGSIGPKLSVNQLATGLSELKRNDGMRLDRSNLLAFFLLGGFTTLPLVTQSAIDKPNGARKLIESGQGFVIPNDWRNEIGRKGDITMSAANALKMGIAKQIATLNGCDVSKVKGSISVAVVIDPRVSL